MLLSLPRPSSFDWYLEVTHNGWLIFFSLWMNTFIRFAHVLNFRLFLYYIVCFIDRIAAPFRRRFTAGGDRITSVQCCVFWYPFWGSRWWTRWWRRTLENPCASEYFVMSFVYICQYFLPSIWWEWRAGMSSFSHIFNRFRLSQISQSLFGRYIMCADLISENKGLIAIVVMTL